MTSVTLRATSYQRARKCLRREEEQFNRWWFRRISDKVTSCRKDRLKFERGGPLFSYPEGCAPSSPVQCRWDARGLLSKLFGRPPKEKIDVTLLLPIGSVSVVTLIRTDTTLDPSQKAEKVCCGKCREKPIRIIKQNFLSYLLVNFGLAQEGPFPTCAEEFG